MVFRKNARALSGLFLWLTSSSHWGVVVVRAQQCANTCPPLVNGVEIPSICEGDSLLNNDDNDVTANVAARRYETCYPEPVRSFSLRDDHAAPGRVTVIANLYIGCNAGRRESGVYAHVAQRYYDTYGDRVSFLISLKGGSSCGGVWSEIYNEDARELYPDSNVVPREMPVTVNDVDARIRDDFFTTPFPHPSYVVLDESLTVRHKFVGPCCGYESYYDCTKATALGLDDVLSGYLDAILQEQGVEEATSAPTATTTAVVPTAAVTTDAPTTDVDDPCASSASYGAWSACSATCPSAISVQFRVLTDTDCAGRAPVETRACPDFLYTACDVGAVCIPEFGSDYEIARVADGFNAPRDVAFHPTPGLHLGDYSEGRAFNSDPNVLEAWVANGGNHSVSIVSSVGNSDQTTLSRRDRGYYHYTVNITALSFNKVSDSGRTEDRDSFNYWALCNDNRNDYLGSKEANYFMGPTLYNSDPKNRNTVNRLGEACSPEEPCHFLHSDMLHESPACIGIVHDPETVTAFGTVYWAFDSTGDNSTSDTGQLVRFDFQQPHGPGSMDHSVAGVRRYPEVQLKRGPPGVHAGMVIDHARRLLYVANPGDGSVTVVRLDTGDYARTAREEYPIFSNKLPSFEYSIWECVEQYTFVNDLNMPSGMELSDNGERLFVAEHETGKILVFETVSGVLLFTIETEARSIGGMTFSPGVDPTLHFVDADTHALYAVKTTAPCREGETYDTNMNLAFVAATTQLGDSSLTRDYSCAVDPKIPDFSFFDQVHGDTGYASNDTTVQANMTGMDPNAALLAERTDCEANSELNFDALLLGGYYCHRCLPEGQGAECDHGGVCSNVQWEGYVCDNEYVVTIGADNVLVVTTPRGVPVERGALFLQKGVTYRFTIKAGDGVPVCVYHEVISGVPLSLPENESGCATNGPLLLTVDDVTTDGGTKSVIWMGSPNGSTYHIIMDVTVAQESSSSKDSADIMSSSDKGTVVGMNTSESGTSSDEETTSSSARFIGMYTMMSVLMFFTTALIM